MNEDVLEEMIANAIAVSEAASGLSCQRTSGSTDCNIPMSMGIPAICVGAYLGDGQHTRQERIRADSLPIGLRIAAQVVLGYFNLEEQV